jgi:2-polyprenyl-6-methoxyphenol hydroxylase-like FAD-dependent oxidoreductase
MSEESYPMKATIVGAGPVACLVAIELRNRSIHVDLYEKDSDIRRSPRIKSHSFNLTLTLRGLNSLDNRMQNLLYANGVKMPQRVVHHVDGSLSYQPYGTESEHYLLSIPRDVLHCTLLNQAESSGARLFFRHECIGANPKQAHTTFVVNGHVLRDVKADILIGCDGTNSAIRHEMSRHGARMHVSQEYIAHGYAELKMPPATTGEHALLRTLRDSQVTESFDHGLHIWPRGDFMLLAQPNVDKSYTTSLFMPLGSKKPNQPSFRYLRTADDASAFFQEYFPDAAKLLPQIATDFLATPPSSLRTLKCFPYHYGCSVLIGDSAHTMVPFYGQGINCSFEDVRAFFDIFDRRVNKQNPRGAISKVLDEFTRIRTGPGNAITDLSLANFPELSSRADEKSYHIRNRLERVLHLCDPNKFMSLYHMVAFTNIPYDKLVYRYEQQRSVVDDLCHRFDIETESDKIIEAYASWRGNSMKLNTDLDSRPTR